MTNNRFAQTKQKINRLNDNLKRLNHLFILEYKISLTLTTRNNLAPGLSVTAVVASGREKQQSKNSAVHKHKHDSSNDEWKQINDHDDLRVTVKVSSASSALDSDSSSENDNDDSTNQKKQ